MKRFLHALAALWPKRKEAGKPPAPPTSTGLRQHLAAVIRMEHHVSECANLPQCGCADSPIRKFAKETVGAGAPGDIVRSSGRTELSKPKFREFEDSPNCKSANNDQSVAALGEFVQSDGGLKLSKRQQSKFANSQIRESAIKLTIVIPVFFMCLMAAKQVSAQAEPAAAAVIKPLQIGDTIPEELWHLPLQVVNHPEGKETITLNDYRGKLIILDFWGTYCTTCIFNMPHLHGLESTFKDDLVIVPVTREGSDRVKRFLETNSTLKPLNLLSVTQGDALFETFPSQTLPHIVLVNQDANVIAITMAEYLDDKIIRKLAANREYDVYIPQKRRKLNVPLLEIANEYDDIRVNNNVYYSMVSGFIDGVSQSMVLKRDSSKNTIRYTESNAYIAQLYTTALNTNLPLKFNRRILEAKKPERYIYQPQTYRDIDLRRENLVTYETVVPSSMNREVRLARMKNDLDHYLQLNARIEPRKVKCLFLKVTHQSTAFIANGGERIKVVSGRVNSRFPERVKEVGALQDGIDTYIRNNGFEEIVGFIQEIVTEPLPVIINDTGHDGRFDLDFPSPEHATLESINKFLRLRGLELQWGEKVMDMFVLTENGFDPSSSVLQLTDMGYTYSSIIQQ